MTAVQCSPALQQLRWHNEWQRVVLWYRVREYTAVLDAICQVDSDYVIMEQDDWMIMAQSVSQKQAALLKLFLPYPEDMTYCAETEQVTVYPIRDLRGVARRLREIVPQASRSMVGRLILNVADFPTLGALHLVLNNPFDILPQRRYPVLLDAA